MNYFLTNSLLFLHLVVLCSEASPTFFSRELFYNNNRNNHKNDTDAKEGLLYSPENGQIYRKSQSSLPYSPPQDNIWNFLDEDLPGHRDALKEERLQHHLHYVMASTAEQPDSGGRSSNFNFWVTLLIAALAAAMLS